MKFVDHMRLACLLCCLLMPLRMPSAQEVDVRSLNSEVVELYKAGKYSKAVPIAKRALKLGEERFGPLHPDVGTSLNNLALLYDGQGRHQEAEPLYKRALEVFEKSLGPLHPDVGATLNNLALLYDRQGRLGDAEPFYTRALKVFEKSLGPLHPDVGATLNNLALLYDGQSRLGDAEPLYKRALGILEESLGRDHPDVGTLLNNLAALDKKQGRFASAASLFERALSINEKAQGPYHPSVATALNNLAEIYKKLDRVEDEKVIRKRLFGMPPKGTRYIPLFFATNRVANENGRYGGLIADTVSFGRLIMRVPDNNLENEAERVGGTSRQPVSDKDSDVSSADIVKIVRLHKQASIKPFANSIAAHQKRANIFRNHVLVFVHGCNTGFDAAMKRATHLAFDLDFDGSLVPFSWPCQTKASASPSDRVIAAKSVDALSSFLEGLRRTLPKYRIHFVAHSMGNQILLPALCEVSKRTFGAKSQFRFGQVIAVQGDEWPGDFEDLTKCMRPIVEGITLYVNKNDKVTRLRCVANLMRFPEDPRCRARDEVRGYTTADVVDVTTMTEDALSTFGGGFDHDVFVRNSLLLNDVSRLLLMGRRPVHKRTQQFRPKKDDQGQTYWVYE